MIASCRVHFVLAVMMAAGNAVAARAFVQATGKCYLQRHVLRLHILGLSLGRDKGGAEDKGSPEASIMSVWLTIVSGWAP